MTSQLVVKETEIELKKLISKQFKRKNKARLKSLLWIKTNKYATRKILSEKLGYHKRTMEKWLAKYNEGGIDNMLLPNYVNRKSRIITPQMHQGLSSRVHDSGNGFSSYVEAQKWVEQEYGVKMNYHWLREYMIKRFKTKIKRPRKSHVKKNEQAITAFLKTA